LEARTADIPLRTYALLALTIGVIATVTTAFVFTDSSGANSSSATTMSTGVSTTIVASQGLGIDLVLPVNPTLGSLGTQFQVNATVWNTLPRQNNVTGVDDYNGVQFSPWCNTGPVTFEVVQGYYTVANFTFGTVLSIHGVQNMMCIVPTSALSYFVFQPKSDVFAGPPARSATIADLLVNVYSSGLASPEPFPAGTYTVVAADNCGSSPPSTSRSLDRESLLRRSRK